MPTYKSKLALSLGQVPDGILDPVLYQELLDIHDAIESLLTYSDETAGVTDHKLLTSIGINTHDQIDAFIESFSYKEVGQPVLLFGTGQSQIVGGPNAITGPYTPNDRVFDWSAQGFGQSAVHRWVNQDLTLPEYADYAADPNAAYTGMTRGRGNQLWAAANAIQKATGRDVYILNVGRNGAGISQYAPGGLLYDLIEQRVAEILATPELAEVQVADGLLWAQGETDGLLPVPDYISAWDDVRTWLQTIIAEKNLTQWSLQDTAVKPPSAFANAKHFWAELDNTNDEYLRVIRADNYEPYDGLHFTGDDAMFMGYKAGLRILEGPVAKMLNITDHEYLTSIGTNTHDQIDTHIADIDIHYSDVPTDGISYVRQDKAWVPVTDDSIAPGTATGQLTRWSGADWLPTSALIVDDAGNVGIGGSPTNRLFVAGPQTSGYSRTLRLRDSSAGQEMDLGGYNDGVSGTGSFIDADAYLSLQIDSAEAMRITSAGNVGIGGTPLTGERLLVNSGAAPCVMRLDSSQGVNGATETIVFSDGQADRASIGSVVAGGAYGGNLTFSTGLSETLTERMRINENGLVGIRTTAPQAAIDTSSVDTGNVTGTSTTAIFRRAYNGNDGVIRMKSAWGPALGDRFSSIQAVSNASGAVAVDGGSMRKLIMQPDGGDLQVGGGDGSTGFLRTIGQILVGSDATDLAPNDPAKWVFLSNQSGLMGLANAGTGLSYNLNYTNTGGWTYMKTGPGYLIWLSAAGLQFFSAPSGTAGTGAPIANVLSIAADGTLSSKGDIKGFQ